MLRMRKLVCIVAFVLALTLAAVCAGWKWGVSGKPSAGWSWDDQAQTYVYTD